MNPAILLLCAVALERLAELWWARRNTTKLLQRGAREYASGHYPLIVGLHAAWLLGLFVFGWSQPVSPGWLMVFAILQAARVWVLVTLGERWTTRIIVQSGEALVTKGPYRFVSHPNYIIVVGEIAVLPLCLGLGWYALIFSALNAAVLFIRIRAENEALLHR